MAMIPAAAPATGLGGLAYRALNDTCNLRETGGRGGGFPIRAVLAVFAILCTLHAAPSFATAVYLARATAMLEILGVTGGNATDLTIDGLFIPPATFSDQFAEGNASATASGFASVIGTDRGNLVVGDGLDLKAEAAGSASPFGSADSFFDAFASVDLFNNSATDTFAVSFRLTWSLFADASVGNLDTEDARAFAGILAETSAKALVAEFAESDVFLGPFGPQSLSDNLVFSLLVLPGGSDFVDIFTTADGFADALPEPGTWALLAMGLMTWAGLRASSRRSRAIRSR